MGACILFLTTRLRPEIPPPNKSWRRALWIVLATLSLCAVIAVGIRVYAQIGDQSSGSPVSDAGFQRRDVYADSNGLVAWYRLNGNLTDSSVSNNAGTLGGPTNPTPTTGKFGGAYSFNQGKVSFSDAALPSGSSARTVSAWVYPTFLSGSSAILSYGTTTTNGHAFGLFYGTSTISVLGEGTTPPYGYSATYTLPINAWSLVTATFDGSIVTIYVNGVSVGSSGALTLNTTLSGTADLGMKINNSAIYVIGKLQDVRVYSRVLSTTEIANLYQGSQPPNCDQTCVGWWKLDETSGTSFADSTYEGNAATSSNSPTFTSGVYSGALTFNGSNQYLSASDAALPSGSSARTIEAWFKTTTVLTNSTYVGILGYGTNSNNEAIFFELGDGGTWGNGTDFGISQYGNAIGASNYTVNDGNWHFGVATFDGTTWRIYVDGLLRASSVLTTNTVNTGTMTIGKDTLNNYWNGSIDDVRVYSRALADYEIYAQYVAGVGQ